MLNCEACGDQFATQEELAQHYRHHPGRITEAYRTGTERIKKQMKCDDDYLAYLKSLEEEC